MIKASNISILLFHKIFWITCKRSNLWVLHEELVGPLAYLDRLPRSYRSTGRNNIPEIMSEALENQTTLQLVLENLENSKRFATAPVEINELLCKKNILVTSSMQ